MTKPVSWGTSPAGGNRWLGYFCVFSADEQIKAAVRLSFISHVTKEGNWSELKSESTHTRHPARHKFQSSAPLWSIGKDSAAVDESVRVTSVERIFVERGAIVAPEVAPHYELAPFKSRVFCLSRQRLTGGDAVNECV